MGKPTRLASRMNWTLIGTILSLLAIHGVVDTAHAQMPTVMYPSGAGRTSEASSMRGRDGLYYFDTAVNGTPLRMAFDTGASYVSLRAEDAERLGIDISALKYTGVAQTANGASRFAPVMIETLSVGGITRHNVQAFVARPGTQSLNLMGQSFLTRIAGFHREGDRIVLQGE